MSTGLLLRFDGLRSHPTVSSRTACALSWPPQSIDITYRNALRLSACRMNTPNVHSDDSVCLEREAVLVLKLGISQCFSQSTIGLRCLKMLQALQSIAQAIDAIEPLHKPVHALVLVGSAIFGHVPMSKNRWMRRWTTCATVRTSLWQVAARMKIGTGISAAASREAAQKAPLQANGHVIGARMRSQ